MFKARLQECNFGAQHRHLLAKGFNLCPVLVHEAVWIDCRQNGVFVLLFDEMALHELRALHLERECVWKIFNPRCLRGLVPFTVVIVLIVLHLATKHVFPGLVEIALVLNVQHNVIQLVYLNFTLRGAFLVRKLNQVLHVVFKHD